MPKWCDEPSPSDWERIEDRVAGGERPYDAARAEGFTLSALKRSDKFRHAAILDAGRDEQGDFARKNLRLIAADTDSTQSVRANELLLKDAGGLEERASFEITGPEGAPLAVEGRAVVGLADVNRLALELGYGHLIGLDAGDHRPELAPASNVLSGAPDDLDSASAVPDHPD